MNVQNIIAKGIGAAGLGLVLYDSHTLGKIESASYQKRASANMIAAPYANTMSQDSASIIEARTRRGFSNFMMEEGISGFFNSIAGYAKGFGSMLVSHVIPLGLSAGALLTKGTTSKVFGLGLLGYGTVYMLREIMGIGKPNELKTYF